MHINIETYEVDIAEAGPESGPDFPADGWYWQVPWMAPEGPFADALAALQDFACWFAAGRLRPRPWRGGD